MINKIQNNAQFYWSTGSVDRGLSPREMLNEFTQVEVIDEDVARNKVNTNSWTQKHQSYFIYCSINIFLVDLPVQTRG